MQCILEKFQLGQIAFLTENREGMNTTWSLPCARKVWFGV